MNNSRPFYIGRSMTATSTILAATAFCWPCANASPLVGPAIAFEERDAAATARISIGLRAIDEYRSIAEDPITAANNDAARGDFRLIQLRNSSMASPSLDADFTGIDCSVPWATGMTKAIWTNSFSDTISPGVAHEKPPFDRLVALNYNAALLRHPNFPYADICVAIGSERMPADRVSAHERALPLWKQSNRWWRRRSDRILPVPQGALTPAIAVRNGIILPALDHGTVDAVDEFGMTALGWAAARAPRSVVQALLKQGADPWFGDYCALKARDWFKYGPLGGNLLATPLVIAVVHQREDVIADMIASAPRKTCRGDKGPGSELDQQLHVMRGINQYAATYKAQSLRRAMLTDLLDRSATGIGETLSVYNSAIEYAWRNGLGDIFRGRNNAELLSAKSFPLYMAEQAMPDELQFWIKRLDLRDARQLGDMLRRVRRLSSSEVDRTNFEQKVDLLIRLTGHFDQAAKDEFLDRIVSGGLGPKGADPTALRFVFTALNKAGFDLNSPNVSRGAGDNCTLLMIASSYSFRDECRRQWTNSTLVSILLDLGVDPNIGRTQSGLSALDIVRKRAGDGPDSAQFSKLLNRMVAAGGRPSDLDSTPASKTSQ